MPATDEFRTLQRQVRQLQVYAGIATAAVLGLMLAAAARDAGEINAQRINIRGSDGKLYMVLAAPERIPGNMFSGKEWPRDLSKGRAESAGILFYSARGDEVGGLLFSAKETPEGPQTFGHLSFDRFRQDQVVALQQVQSGTSERAGLNVWDIPPGLPNEEIVGALDHLRRGTPEQRAAARAKLSTWEQRGDFGHHRVFLGSQDKTALLALKDSQGKDRVRLAVDKTGAARLEFLDAAGRVTDAYPRAATP